MRVLSLFDGISCGLVALKELGYTVDYYSSEIDPHAIGISRYNHGGIVRLGDVTSWREWSIDWSFDLVLGGSPCQGLSLAGKQLGMNDPRSRLFYVFADILDHVRKHNPKVSFLFENTRMTETDRSIISRRLNCFPKEVNSALLSAHNRVRLYWTSRWFDMPTHSNERLVDVLEGDWSTDRDKSLCIDANYYKGGVTTYFQKARRQLVFRGDEYRLLTPRECERLQKLPDDYTRCVSKKERYRGLGNGWTVSVIKHILSEIL